MNGNLEKVRAVYYVGEGNVPDGVEMVEWARRIAVPLNKMGVEVILTPNVSGRGLEVIDPSPFPEEMFTRTIHDLVNITMDEVDE